MGRRGCLRWAARTDENEAGIVSSLREAGVSVQKLGRVGGGCPDLLLGFEGYTILAEIKTEGGSVRENQREWHRGWRGGPVIVARDVEDIFKALGIDGK